MANKRKLEVALLMALEPQVYRRRTQPGCPPGEHGNDACGPARHSPEGPVPHGAQGSVAVLAKAASIGCGLRLAPILFR